MKYSPTKQNLKKKEEKEVKKNKAKCGETFGFKTN